MKNFGFVDYFNFLNHNKSYIWKPPSLSELNPIVLNMELTHIDSQASISWLSVNNM